MSELIYFVNVGLGDGVRVGFVAQGIIELGHDAHVVLKGLATTLKRFVLVGNPSWWRGQFSTHCFLHDLANPFLFGGS